MRSIIVASLAALFITPVTKADEPVTKAAATADTSKSNDYRKPPEAPIAKQYEQIKAEYEAQLAARRQARAKAAIPREKSAAAESRPRDLIVHYSRRMVDLAESSPGDPAARDAMLWVINQPGKADRGPYGDEFSRAAALLVRHHGDDPEAVRVALGLDNVVTAHRDSILLGFYAAAKGREAKGLARLALAQYLAEKAKEVAYARSVEGRPKSRFFSGGKVREIDLTDERYADLLALRQCDPQIIHNEAVRLFEEVISEYSDIPYITRGRRELEAFLKEPAPRWNGKPLTPEDRHKIETRLARKKTLGQEAEARLDEMLNLAIDKPAPEIEGVDVDGKPLKLSDYKGKIVMLVFWGTWCGPCMALVPRERDLVARFKGQPFALLGVDCEDDKETARKVMARERMTWPSWFDGPPGTGPIAQHYHAQVYPAVFILDAKGVIRGRHVVDLDKFIGELLDEMQQPASGRERLRHEPSRDQAPRR